MGEVVLGVEVGDGDMEVMGMKREGDVKLGKEDVKVREEELKEIGDKIYRELKKV